MQEDNRNAINFLDLLIGVSEGDVKAVNYGTDNNETLGFFNKRASSDEVNLVEYEITRHRTGITDIRIRKDK